MSDTEAEEMAAMNEEKEGTLVVFLPRGLDEYRDYYGDVETEEEGGAITEAIVEALEKRFPNYKIEPGDNPARFVWFIPNTEEAWNVDEYDLKTDVDHVFETVLTNPI